MEAFQNLMMGFSVALTPENLLFAFLGSLLGTFLGVLPGVGSVSGMVILIPLTYHLPPVGAIIMLAAMWYGSNYGGTITSVLMNVPGEGSSAITCVDGYPMAKQGRAGPAIAISAIGSFVGGTLGTFALVFAAAPLTKVAMEFGPAESFGLVVLGLSLVSGLAGNSMLKALIMAAFGLAVGCVGIDPSRGTPRFVFGQMDLMDGISFVPICMGLFGLGEILLNAETIMKPVFVSKIKSLWPTVKDFRDSTWPIIRGTVIGFFMGLIPGMPATASSFSSYVAETKLSRTPEKFGTGMIEGVAGPETANNSHCQGALVPLFTLGIPASASMAVLMGAFMMNGIIPGPLMFREHPDVAWGVIASLYVGNLMLLILNLPLVGLWVSMLKIPYPILFAVIVGFMVLGAYSLENSAFDVGMLLLFGILGYAFKKLDFPLAPAVLTVILGPMMERKLVEALQMSGGNPSILWESWISMTFLGLAAVALALPLVRGGLKLRRTSFMELGKASMARRS